MSINLTLIGQAITFGIFVWFTMKYVWPLIISAMQEREQTIADGLAAAERGHYELEKAHKKAKEIIDEAMSKATDIVEKANHRANVIVDESKQEAKEKYNQIVASAETDIMQQTAKLKEELRKEVASIAVLGAERIIRRSIDNKVQNDLISDFVANL